MKVEQLNLEQLHLIQILKKVHQKSALALQMKSQVRPPHSPG